MKKLALSLLLLLVTGGAGAQVSTVYTDIYGKFEVMVDLEDGGYAVVNMYGDILEIDTQAFIDYYSDFWSYEAGKVKRIGNVSFSYYSDFWSYESGKKKSIGNVGFQYYSDFWSYEAGKVKSIGRTQFSYYSDFNDWECGKLKSIGGNRYSYVPSYNGRRGSIPVSGRLKVEDGGIAFRVMGPAPRRRY